MESLNPLWQRQHSVTGVYRGIVKQFNAHYVHYGDTWIHRYRRNIASPQKFVGLMAGALMKQAA